MPARTTPSVALPLCMPRHVPLSPPFPTYPTGCIVFTLCACQPLPLYLHYWLPAIPFGREAYILTPCIPCPHPSCPPLHAFPCISYLYSCNTLDWRMPGGGGGGPLILPAITYYACYGGGCPLHSPITCNSQGLTTLAFPPERMGTACPFGVAQDLPACELCGSCLTYSPPAQEEVWNTHPCPLSPYCQPLPHAH